MKPVIKARDKLVEDVSGSSHGREEDQRRTFSAPIKLMQTDPVHIDKVTFVMRTIHILILFESALPGYHHGFPHHFNSVLPSVNPNGKNGPIVNTKRFMMQTNNAIHQRTPSPG